MGGRKNTDRSEDNALEGETLEWGTLRVGVELRLLCGVFLVDGLEGGERVLVHLGVILLVESETDGFKYFVGNADAAQHKCFPQPVFWDGISFRQEGHLLDYHPVVFLHDLFGFLFGYRKFFCRKYLAQHVAQDQAARLGFDGAVVGSNLLLVVLYNIPGHLQQLQVIVFCDDLAALEPLEDILQRRGGLLSDYTLNKFLLADASQTHLVIEPLENTLNFILFRGPQLGVVAVLITYLELLVPLIQLGGLVLHHQHLVLGIPLFKFLTEGIDSGLQLGLGEVLVPLPLLQLLSELLSPLLHILEHIGLVVKAHFQLLDALLLLMNDLFQSQNILLDALDLLPVAVEHLLLIHQSLVDQLDVLELVLLLLDLPGVVLGPCVVEFDDCVVFFDLLVEQGAFSPHRPAALVILDLVQKSQVVFLFSRSQVQVFGLQLHLNLQEFQLLPDILCVTLQALTKDVVLQVAGDIWGLLELLQRLLGIGAFVLHHRLLPLQEIPLLLLTVGQCFRQLVQSLLYLPPAQDCT